MNKVLQRIAQTWWLFALVFIMMMASFGILFALEDQFTEITNAPVFDTQNNLTREILLQELPLYTGEARSAYDRFAAFDFVFPFVAALFLAVLWTFLLRTMTWRIGSELLKYHIPLFVFFTTAFDYMENVSILLVLNTTGTPSDSLIQSVLLFKGLKLTSLSIIVAVTWFLVMVSILNLVYRLVVSRKMAKITS